MEGHLRSLGPLVTEAVEVGVFFKKVRTFAEVRRRRDGLSLEMLLSRRLASPRVSKVLGQPGRRAAHFFVVRDIDDIDDEILDWLAEAYDASPE